MPASLIQPKTPFQTWIWTQASDSHQPISPVGTMAYTGVSQLCHEDRAIISKKIVGRELKSMYLNKEVTMIGSKYRRLINAIKTDWGNSEWRYSWTRKYNCLGMQVQFWHAYQPQSLANASIWFANEWKKMLVLVFVVLAELKCPGIKMCLN